MIPKDIKDIDYIKAIKEDSLGNKYETIKPVEFWVENMDLGEWDLLDNNDKLIASAKKDKLIIHPGFKWDGCSVIGELYEDKYTLQASLLHDVLYTVLSVEGFKAPFSALQADYWFTTLLRIISGRKTLPRVYRAALAVAGTPYRLLNSSRNDLRVIEY